MRAHERNDTQEYTGDNGLFWALALAVAWTVVWFIWG